MRLKSLCLSIAIAGAVFSPAASPAATGPCPPASPALAGRPAGLPSPAPEQPVRNDPGGARTITVTVEDPSDAPHRYTYAPLSLAPSTGLFMHRWPTATHVVTVGLYVDADGIRSRIPLLLVEGGSYDDATASLVEAALIEALPLANNALTVGLNTVMPTPVVLAATLASGNPAGDALWHGWFASDLGWPDPAGYADRAPLYIWTTYRNAPGADVWQGIVVTHQGWYHSATVGTVTTREACRRTRIGVVARSGAQTTYLGGVFLDDHALSVRDSATKSFSGRQRISAGTSASGVDVPITTIEQKEMREGEALPGLPYARYQKDEITLGVTVNGTFVPLVGTRAEAWHANAFAGEGDGQRRLASVGVYDHAGVYHPVAGYRWRFQYWPADFWPTFWTLGGGPGSEVAGDWEADVGVFDLTGNFVPLLGATYDDSFAEGTYRYQMMITAGAWVGSTYQPAVGFTYDGQTPLVAWALADTGDRHDLMGRWIVSAGTFSPLGGYVPLIGATYAPGTATPAEPVAEQYRVGVFPGSYSQAGQSRFIAVAGADWYSSHTSGKWISEFAASRDEAPADARINVGPAVAGAYTPVAEVRAKAGQPDRYGVGVYVLGGFVPLAQVCHSHEMYGFGVATGTGAPLVWAGYGPGGPSGGVLADCPA